MTSKNKYILFFIIILGLLIRILFVFVISDYYIVRDNLYFDADTTYWINSFINLWETGTYTCCPETEYGYFVRMPGYSFVLGFFWLICGKNPEMAYMATGWFQIFLDIFAILLVYKAARNIFKSNRPGLIAAILYATYPFIIVWTPLAYSETTSVFCLIASVYFISGQRKYRYIFAGILVGAAFLLRPQTILLAPAIALFIVVFHRRNPKQVIKFLLQFGLAATMIYGGWPLRNYVNHNKIILTQDLRGAGTWSKDVLSFMQYTYSVKTEWDPQFTDILHNRKVQFPTNAYSNKEDSIKLVKAVDLCKTCGSGFSNWTGYWKERLPENESCNDEIEQLFNELRASQIDRFPMNFYLWLPLQNLRKTVLKNELNNTEGIRKFASILFFYRTFLILAGFVGCFVLFRRRNLFWLVFACFAFFLYFALCFGTGPQFRNIEIRYFLHADVLLLFPVAFLIISLYELVVKRKNRIQNIV